MLSIEKKMNAKIAVNWKKWMLSTEKNGFERMFGILICQSKINCQDYGWWICQLKTNCPDQGKWCQLKTNYGSWKTNWTCQLKIKYGMNVMFSVENIHLPCALGLIKTNILNWKQIRNCHILSCQQE